MNKKNRIIVLIDLSEYSENLISFALNFAKCMDAKVILVHQVLGMVPALADKESRNEIIRAEMEDAADHLSELAHGKLEDDSLVISQQPVLKILNNLKSNAYNDWVFAGLKGTGLLKRLFIGSTTLSIINESDLLTVAVPVSSVISVPKKLVVGVTHRFPLNKPQFEILLSALAQHIRGVEFFTILPDDEDEDVAQNYLLSLQSEYSAYNSSIFLTKGTDKFDALKSHVQQAEQCFLVLQQGSRSLMDELFRKFMINELVYSGSIPLIVLSK